MLALQITCAEAVVCLWIQAPSTGPGRRYLEVAQHSRSISYEKLTTRGTSMKCKDRITQKASLDVTLNITIRSRINVNIPVLLKM